MAFTYFFRDMQTLEMIRDYALPTLRTKRHIKVWDAGCAMGPEPYSLAIILRENMGNMIFRNVKIFATDIDGSNLFQKIIENGEYPHDQLSRIPRDIFYKYFSKVGNSENCKISDEIIKSIKYSKHDLLSLKPVANDFGLIMCKNVLLHFKYEERVEVIRMFYDTLIDGGYFVSEQTQKMPVELEKYFEQVVPNAQIYRKVAPVTVSAGSVHRPAPAPPEGQR
ncbi:MAG TPA: CheR family methyltransferase [Spirochaetota bacterium]|nr:CheR family methyltransferase [Spirochaetota bacterium]HPS86333.1 CheR family methyltransferase [Spirochaetota bacterium]